MTRLQAILSGVAIALSLAYVAWALWIADINHEDVVCSRFDIIVTDSLKQSFINRDDIRNSIALNGQNPVGQPMRLVNTDSIERLLSYNPMIRSAQCYKTNGDRVYLKISQRTPMFRVIGRHNYYVDTDRQLMPTSTHYSAYVPVVTGLEDQSLAKTEIYDFVEYITNDDFWNAQIEQIVVHQDTTVDLVPRVGNHIIRLGKLTRYPQKLDKMLTLYKKGFDVIGWPDYKIIDLRFRNQIICKK